MERKRGCDISLLSFLRSAAEQNDQGLAVFREIDTITWSPIDPHLADAAEPLDARRIAGAQPRDGRRDLGRCLMIQPIESRLEWNRAVCSDVLFHAERHGLNGNTCVTICGRAPRAEAFARAGPENLCRGPRRRRGRRSLSGRGAWCAHEEPTRQRGIAS